MGTLTNQPERKQMHTRDQVPDRLQYYMRIAKENQVSLSDVLKVKELLELERRNNLYVANGDIHDEQLAGFGKLFEKFIDTFEYAFGVSEFGQNSLEKIAETLGYTEE